MQVVDLLNELKILSKEDLEKRIKNLTEEEKELLNNSDKCENTKGHTYKGYNLYFILTLRGPGIYGTFNQWREEGRSIKKGSKGIPMLTPIFADKEKEEVKFFKTTYVFNKEDTEENPKQD